MTCCPANIVCYALPQDCAAPQQRRLTPPGMADPVLVRNTSGFNIAGAGQGNMPIGTAIPDLTNGFVGGSFTAEQQAFRVDCGGTTNFIDTIQIDVDIVQGADGARRMLGFGYWNGYGTILNDGDGLGGLVVHFFDAANTLLGTQALPNVNSAAFHSAALAFGSTDQVDRIEIHIGQKPFPGSNHANLREIAPIWAYRSAADWRCFGRQVTATIDYTGESIAPAVLEGNTTSGAMMVAGAGITITPTNLIQTNGPHSMTFTSNGPFEGTIITNQPGNFSSLTVSDSNPTITVTGNMNQTFDIDWDFPNMVGAAIRSAVLTDGDLRDLATGAIVDPETVIIVSCN